MNTIIQSKTILGNVTGMLPFMKWEHISLLLKYRRLFVIAALFHIALAVGLSLAGRSQIAPSLIDRDGIMASFAFDSYEYREKAIHLVEVAKQSGIKAWAKEPAPLHVKLISLEFAILGPIFGYTPLSAEPLNLLFYLAVIALTFLIGNELGGERIGLFSAVAVALFPTFLLHNLQLLKDPLFIAGVLFLILSVATWLTRTYDRSAAIAMSVLMTATVLILLLVRLSFGVAFLGIVLLGLILLIARQLREKRLLYWNMFCPVILLFLVGFALIPFYGAIQIQKVKQYPSTQSGELKSNHVAEFQIPAIISIKPRPNLQNSDNSPFSKPVLTVADNLALKLGYMRTRYAVGYSEAGSVIDRDKEIGNLMDLIFYLPRAFKVGLWAPFPNTWITSGQRIGNVGKLLSGAETLVIYACQFLALFTVVFGHRRLASLLLLFITTLSVTALGLIIPNVGAIYRFRYTFWILMIILGIKGFETVITLFRQGFRRQSLKDTKTGTVLLIACFLLLSFTSCSIPSSSDIKSPDALNLQKALPEGNSVPAPVTNDLTLINFTGASVRAIYLSPSESIRWEENILGGDVISDEDIVDISFSNEGKNVLWDLRIEGISEHYAEWKNLDLRKISRIKLILGHKGEKVAVAELE